MVPSSNEWQLEKKKSFLDTSVNWLLTVLVSSMWQHHCVLPALWPSWRPFYTARWQVRGWLCSHVSRWHPEWRLHGWASETCSSQGSQELAESQLWASGWRTVFIHVPCNWHDHVHCQRPRQVCFSHGHQGKEGNACSTTSFTFSLSLLVPALPHVYKGVMIITLESCGDRVSKITSQC